MVYQAQHTRLFFSRAHMYWQYHQFRSDYLHFLKLLHTLACYLKTIGWHLFLTHLDVFYDDERKDGRVFIGTLLLYILKVNGIKVVNTIKYPQAITICERIHQAISTNLWATLHHHPPQTFQQINHVLNTCLAVAA